MHDVEVTPGPETERNIPCLYINARSIVNKLTELQILTNDIEVLAITETWLKPDIRNSEIFPNLP